MIAATDALTVLRAEQVRAGRAGVERYDAAIDAVAKLIAAAGPVLRHDMTTVRGRMEMIRRLRVLDNALRNVQGGAA